jgi:hypothetical protein
VTPAGGTRRTRVIGWLRSSWVGWSVFFVATAAATALLVPGHFWGDDWTLYVRQGEALVHGGVRRVIADVTFTARQSTMREFTPEGYPWGTPALLVVPIALFGRSIAAMKLTMALSFGVAVTAWYALGRRWVGSVAAVGGAALMVVSLPLVSWTNLIASDIPYLAAVGLAALTFTRAGSAAAHPLRSPTVMGAMAALAFAFRQEGLVVLAAAVVGFGMRRLASRRAEDDDTSRKTLGSSTVAWLRESGIAVLTFIACTAVVRLVLPSQILPRYSTAGPGRIRENLPFFARSIGSQFGVYDPVDRRVEAFGVPALGWALAALLVVLVAVGAVLLLRRRRPLDIFMAVIAAGHLYGALTFPFPDTRYMFVPFAVSCLVAAFTAHELAQLMATMVGSVSGRARITLTRSIALAVIGLLVVNQVSPYVTAAQGAATARRIDRPAFSPFEPAPQEMFAAVRERTAEADVIAFSAARAMTFFTDRRAVQVRGDDPVPAVADWLVVERLPDGAMPQPAGFLETWNNERYALLRLDPAGA